MSGSLAAKPRRSGSTRCCDAHAPGSLGLVSDGSSSSRGHARTTQGRVQPRRRPRAIGLSRRTGTLDVRRVPVSEQLTQPLRPALLILMAAVVLVFLIACLNVTNLSLARATTVSTSLGPHALGASRSRIVRQLVGESPVLAVRVGHGRRSSRCGAITRSWRPHREPQRLLHDVGRRCGWPGIAPRGGRLDRQCAALRPRARTLGAMVHRRRH